MEQPPPGNGEPQGERVPAKVLGPQPGGQVQEGEPRCVQGAAGQDEAQRNILAVAEPWGWGHGEDGDGAFESKDEIAERGVSCKPKEEKEKQFAHRKLSHSAQLVSRSFCFRAGPGRCNPR